MATSAAVWYPGSHEVLQRHDAGGTARLRAAAHEGGGLWDPHGVHAAPHPEGPGGAGRARAGAATPGGARESTQSSAGEDLLQAHARARPPGRRGEAEEEAVWEGDSFSVAPLRRTLRSSWPTSRRSDPPSRIDTRWLLRMPSSSSAGCQRWGSYARTPGAGCGPCVPGPSLDFVAFSSSTG